MSLVLDVTRLIGRSCRATPTGIDRFERHYAGWARSHSDRTVFVETTRHGPAIVKRERVEALIAAAHARWLGNEACAHGTLQAIAAAIADARPLPAFAVAPGTATATRTEALLDRAIGSLRAITSLRAGLPPDAAFVHVSHARLDISGAFDWLGRSRRRGIFYVHDLIPLTHPEFVRPAEPDRHERRIRTILRHGRLIVCNSQVTAAAVTAFAATRGLEQPHTAVVPPGIEPAFLRAVAPDALVPKRPYFVCVGTIEPRKNHALLLNLWRRLRERDGAAAPCLLLVGRRGWNSRDLFQRLDQAEGRHGALLELTDASDAVLAPLLAGAAALLAPSLTEGYGMPVVEALALGTPVIASDIPSHREIAAGAATLLDPLDGPGWLAAIDAHASQRRTVALRLRPRRTWSDHFALLERRLGDAGRHAASLAWVCDTARSRAEAVHSQAALLAAAASPSDTITPTAAIPCR